MEKSRIAERLRQVRVSPSSAIVDRIAALRREGKTIINLAIGEPDFDTPPLIRRAASEAIERGETRYTQTAGTMALRTAIAGKLARENDLSYAPEHIIVTCGAKHAIFNALSVTLNPGDEVLVPSPYWVSYPDMVLACGGKPIVLPSEEVNDFKLTPAALEAAITPASRWLILNYPNNPTGTVHSREELAALAAVLMRHPHVMVLTDDIYEHISFDQQKVSHILAVEPRLKDRTMVINGVSKTYAMTGWRIGYAAGPSDLVAAMDMLQSQSTSGASSVSQAAAVAALNGEQTVVQEMNAQYAARRDRALTMLDEIPGLSCRGSAGAFYLFVNCQGLIGKRNGAGAALADDVAVVRYLLEQANVSLLPGSAYGTPGYLRLSIAVPVSVLEDGLTRIAAAVSSLV